MLVTLRHKTVHVGNLFSHHHHYHQSTSVNNTSSPSTFGRRFSSGTSTSSMTIWPVTEALRENLPSILGAESPFIPCKDETKKKLFVISYSDVLYIYEIFVTKPFLR